MFIRNSWYVGAWSKEVGRKPLRRVLLNEPVMFYRLESGEVAALEDRCAHRNYPLSKGCVIGDTVQCGYHGLVYGPDGNVTRAPGQDILPRTAAIRSFRVIEYAGLVWFWPGDDAACDPALLPDLDWINQPGWTPRFGGYLHLKARQELLTENLLDASHVGYLHKSTIGGEDSEGHSNARTEIFPFERGVKRRRQMPAVLTPPAFKDLCPTLGERVDSWNYSEMRPGLYQNYFGAKPVDTGAFDGDEEGFYQSRTVQGITPETDDTTHYFFGGAELTPLARGSDEEYLARTSMILLEDIDALEAIVDNERLVPGRRIVNLANDAAVIQYRIVIKRLADREAGAKGARPIEAAQAGN